MKTFEEMKQDVRYKANELKFRARVKANELKNWAINNKEYVIAVGIPTALAIIAEGRRISDRIGVEYRRENTVWDPSSRVLVPLRRRMNKKEKLEFARRRAAGERVYDILISMRLI